MIRRVCWQLVFLVLLSLTVALSTASAVPVAQYASAVEDYSSQWGNGGYEAFQTLGEDNTGSYGDTPTAWAPLQKNGTSEFIVLNFATAVYANGISIWESWGNGFVDQVELIDTADVSHLIWAGVDPSLPGSVVRFDLSWELTDYLVDTVRISFDTNHNMETWEEIDAVQLHGDTEPAPAPVPEPATLLLLGFGLLGLALWRRITG